MKKEIFKVFKIICSLSIIMLSCLILQCGDVTSYENDSSALTAPDINESIINTSILKERLVAFWNFNGNTLDKSEFKNDIPVVKAPTTVGYLGTTSYTGFSFNGAGNYLELPYRSSVNPAQFTISAWVYPTPQTGKYGSVITSRSPISKGYIIYKGSNEYWQFWVGNGSATYPYWDVLSGTKVVNYKWTHLAATYDGATMRFYVDFKLVGSRMGKYVISDSRPLRIGAGATEYDTPQFYFSGKIDEVKIYSYVLSLEKIKLAHDIFTNYVSVGDSLTHAFQSGFVWEPRDTTKSQYKYQSFSYPNQMATKIFGTQFVQPLSDSISDSFIGYSANLEEFGVAYNSGIQSEIDKVKRDIEATIVIGPVRSDSFLKQSTLNNFGITGATTRSIFTDKYRSGELIYDTFNKKSFYYSVLAPGGAPALYQALNRNPTFLSVWIGNNDALAAALMTDIFYLTPLADFKEDYQIVVTSIKNKQKEGALMGVVIANIPDVGAIPYLEETPCPADANQPVGTKCHKPFWVCTDNIACEKKLSYVEKEVLTPADIKVISTRIKEFNSVIKMHADANGWALLDVHTIFNNILTNGGINLTTSTTSGNRNSSIKINSSYYGGIFGLDGVHCSNTGYALVANNYRDAIQSKYGTLYGFTLPYINEEEVYNLYDPLPHRNADPRPWMDDNPWMTSIIDLIIHGGISQ